jgi:hypothetical protein
VYITAAAAAAAYFSCPSTYLFSSSSFSCPSSLFSSDYSTFTFSSSG